MTDIVRLLEERGVHWSLWALKDRGQIGILKPRNDSSWLHFLQQTSIAQPLQALQAIAGVTFGEMMQGGILQQQMTQLFPDENPDLRARLTREAQRPLEHLAMRFVARRVAELPSSARDALAQGFAFHHCEVFQPLLDALHQGTQGAIRA